MFLLHAAPTHYHSLTQRRWTKCLRLLQWVGVQTDEMSNSATLVQSVGRGFLAAMQVVWVLAGEGVVALTVSEAVAVAVALRQGASYPQEEGWLPSNHLAPTRTMLDHPPS